MNALLILAQDRLVWKCAKAVLTGLLLAAAIGVPVQAQTTNVAEDGTVLKEIIIFGRHGIRAPTSQYTGPEGLNQFAADVYPDFVDSTTGLVVSNGILTLNGKRAAELLGSYFREYLRHEGLLAGNTNDLAHSYFRANIIERSYMTAARFGAGLIANATIPVHTYNPAMTNADPVFDPLLAGVATVDPVRALAEVQGVFGSGASIESAYSGELSLISKVLYPPGTAPTNTPPQPGSIDPTTLPITIATSGPPYFTGNVIDMGGLDTLVDAADPFVMEYADGLPTTNVGWGRLTVAEISQQTRIDTLQINISMRQPYLARVQSSSAASHVLRTMLQAISGGNLAGAFGDTNTQIHVIISSDYYVSGLAGLLDAHWQLPGYQPDFCPPGGALVFELRQIQATGEYLVRVFYTAQTFAQLRNLTPLDLANPPATMQLFIPGCSSPATNLDVSFSSFSNLLIQAIDTNCVPPFDQEIPPGVLNPYINANPTNITLSFSGQTPVIAWPADHLGWILQIKTNSLLSANPWLNLPGTADYISAPIPTDPGAPVAFYRLSLP